MIEEKNKLKLETASEEQDNSEEWLISYADMMTLIACFFILMMAFANYDPVGFDKKAQELSKAFNEGKYKPSKDKLTELTEEIARHPNIMKKTKITTSESETIITFSGSVIYKKGSYDIDQSILPQLDTLIDIIRTKDPNYKVVIEGHADPFEHKENENLSSAWDLGGMRATRVLSRFEYLGFNPLSMVALSKGDSEPALSTTDATGKPIEENNEFNRRVVIKVIESSEPTQKIKFGFGIYFNE